MEKLIEETDPNIKIGDYTFGYLLSIRNNYDEIQKVLPDLESLLEEILLFHDIDKINPKIKKTLEDIQMMRKSIIGGSNEPIAYIKLFGVILLGLASVYYFLSHREKPITKADADLKEKKRSADDIFRQAFESINETNEIAKKNLDELRKKIASDMEIEAIQKKERKDREKERNDEYIEYLSRVKGYDSARLIDLREELLKLNEKRAEFEDTKKTLTEPIPFWKKHYQIHYNKKLKKIKDLQNEILFYESLEFLTPEVSELRKRERGEKMEKEYNEKKKEKERIEKEEKERKFREEKEENERKVREEKEETYDGVKFRRMNPSESLDEDYCTLNMYRNGNVSDERKFLKKEIEYLNKTIPPQNVKNVVVKQLKDNNINIDFVECHEISYLSENTDFNTELKFGVQLWLSKTRSSYVDCYILSGIIRDTLHDNDAKYDNDPSNFFEPKIDKFGHIPILSETENKIELSRQQSSKTLGNNSASVIIKKEPNNYYYYFCVDYGSNSGLLPNQIDEDLPQRALLVKFANVEYYSRNTISEEGKLIVPDNVSKTSNSKFPNLHRIYHQNSHLDGIHSGNITSVCGAWSALYGYYILYNLKVSDLNKPLNTDGGIYSSLMDKIYYFGSYKTYNSIDEKWWEFSSEPENILKNKEYFLDSYPNQRYSGNYIDMPDKYWNFTNNLILLTQKSPSDEDYTFCVVKKNGLFYLIDTSGKYITKDDSVRLLDTAGDDSVEKSGIYVYFKSRDELKNFIKECYTTDTLYVNSNIVKDKKGGKENHINFSAKLEPVLCDTPFSIYFLGAIIISMIIISIIILIISFTKIIDKETYQIFDI